MKRPNISQEVIAAAARRVTKTLDGLRNSEKGLLAEAITAAYSYPMSMRKLVQILESDFGWDSEMLDVSGLSKLDDIVRDEHRKACKEWVGDNDIKPRLSIGDQVLCISRALEGSIKDIPHEDAPGCFLLALNSEDDDLDFIEVIASFEDVVPL